MKTFGEKIRRSRENLGISQDTLAKEAGVSQRTITSYETNNSRPRGITARKLAKALGVSVDYLLNEDVDDPKYGMEKDPYMEAIRKSYGPKAEKEANELLEKNMALFAGGTLTQEAKDAFFEAVMTAYVTCKEEARKTYSNKKGDN
ncbi:helix-turn-helix domain-containing protein [Alkalibacter mobilis]|uniref:helix-turn-helix domain-containing protein n=1 Tax=Alkalibacter mobilis TaxID=2787712 RepID=UPI00189DE783|nr:helix-turn-helix transcriptional regulator [Alkalibacter mobilis]MBF7097442.1 helix-turn-helix transcriptional regulator [Alkalibacter mobilis]